MRNWSGTVPRAIFVDSISTQSLDAQDFDDHLDFKLHITEATPPQTGRFEARFKLFNEEKPEHEQVLVFQLVQLKNGWRIDDINLSQR